MQGLWSARTKPSQISVTTRGRQSWTVSLQEWNLNRSRIQDITGKLLWQQMQRKWSNQTRSSLRPPKWMNRGRAGGLPVTAVRNGIRFSQRGFVRQKKWKTQDCTFAAWDCMKHIFWGKTKIILRKSVMSIWLRTAIIMTGGSSIRRMTSRNRQNKAVCCLFFSETAGIKAGSVSMIRNGKHITVTSGSWVRRFT